MKRKPPDLIADSTQQSRTGSPTRWLYPLRTIQPPEVSDLLRVMDERLAPPTDCYPAKDKSTGKKKRVLPRPSDSEIGSAVIGVVAAPQPITNDIVPPPLQSGSLIFLYGCSRHDTQNCDSDHFLEHEGLLSPEAHSGKLQLITPR